MVTRRPTKQAQAAPSDKLIQELRLHREAIEKAAREEEDRYRHKEAMEGFRLIRARTSSNAVTAKPEDVPTRQARRLARFRELGGTLRPSGEGWQRGGAQGALAALTREEGAAGRPRSTRQDVTQELKKAATAEKMQS